MSARRWPSWLPHRHRWATVTVVTGRWPLRGYARQVCLRCGRGRRPR